MRKIRLRVTSERTLIGMLLALAVLLAGLFAPGMVLQRKLDGALYTRYLLPNEPAALSQTALTKGDYDDVLSECFVWRNEMLTEDVLLFHEPVDGQISMNAASNTALETARLFAQRGLIPQLSSDTLSVVDVILLNATGLQDAAEIDYRASFWRVQMYDEEGTFLVMLINALDACVWSCYVEFTYGDFPYADPIQDCEQMLKQYADYLECATPQQQMDIQIEGPSHLLVGMAQLPQDSFNVAQECMSSQRGWGGMIHFYITPKTYTWQQMLQEYGMWPQETYNEAQEGME